jgi:hypothetical protein
MHQSAGQTVPCGPSTGGGSEGMPAGGFPSSTSVAAEPDGVRDAPHTCGQAPSVPGVKMPWLSPQPIGLGVQWPWGALQPPEVGIGGFGSCITSCRRRGQRVPAKRNSPGSAGCANYTDLQRRARAFGCTNPRGKRCHVARAWGAGARACPPAASPGPRWPRSRTACATHHAHAAKPRRFLG